MTLNLMALERMVGPTEAVSPPAPVARSLADLTRATEDDPTELLKSRYLCQGGGLLFVGPTGVGKSSFSMQAMVAWALGLPAFGITPARKLKSLLVQAENDEGDLAEMRDGVMAGMNLTPEQREEACLNIRIATEDVRCGLSFIVGVLRPLLAEHKPDLAWIDPALAYLGGEASSQKDVGGFLRNLLNPLLHEFKCGCVVVHHTNKPPSGKEKPDWRAGDFAYLGSGSAEWVNWARAMLVLRGVGSHSIYELRAGKRGKRLGWTEADGVTAAYCKMIAHSREPGVICWREAEVGEIPAEAGRKNSSTKEDVLPHVPLHKSISKEALRSKCNAAGIALNKINGLIAELIEDGSLYEWRVERKGTNAQRLISREPQPVGELLQ